MKASELRLGNWVEYGNYVNLKLIGISELFQILNDGGATVPPSNYEGLKPIQITEDWLLRFGFEKVNSSGLKYYNNSKLNITLDFSINYDAGQRVYLKYVHQLQNLYFALTNEELIIK